MDDTGSNPSDGSVTRLQTWLVETTVADLPVEVRRMATRCLLDLSGTAAAGATTQLSRIIRDHAVEQFGASVLAPLERGRVLIERAAGGQPETRVEVVRNLGAMRIRDVGVDLTGLGGETYSVRPFDPVTARAIARRTAEFTRGDWHVRIETKSTLSFADDDWQLESALEATEGETVVFSRTWKTRHERHGPS